MLSTQAIFVKEFNALTAVFRPRFDAGTVTPKTHGVATGMEW